MWDINDVLCSSGSAVCQGFNRLGLRRLFITAELKQLLTTTPRHHQLQLEYGSLGVILHLQDNVT